jgi:hypothetical protein
MSSTYSEYCVYSSSFLGSTAQLRPWPPLRNPAEFLGGFSTIFFLQSKVVSPTPNPHPGGPGLCIYNPQRQILQIINVINNFIVWIVAPDKDRATNNRQTHPLIGKDAP